MYTCLDDDDLVFKIDDDIVFISNGSFENMIIEYLKNDHFILSANVVNHPILSASHLRLRAILPFHQVSEFSFKKSENKSEEIDKTLVMGIVDSKMWWSNGSLAAISHESLLYNVYNNNIGVYDFKIYDFNTIDYTRWSINFILSWGKNFNKINTVSNYKISDEVILGMNIPKKMKKHSVALGSAVVSHFSYFPQANYLSKTDLLEKYHHLSIYYLSQ